MSRQTKLSQYIKKVAREQPKKGSKNDKRESHNSSREGSQATERLHDSDEDVVMEVYHEHKLVCPSFVLLTPSIMIYYHSLERNLRELCDHYSKQKVVDFILSNLKHSKIDNLKNLEQIKDDDFWGHELPFVIEMAYKHIRQIECSVRILVSGVQEVADISRLQVFVILACMFLGILPPQMHEENVNFGELMTIRQNELYPTRVITRRQKLKCFMAYFKHIVRHQAFLKGHIRFQRTKSANTDFMDYMKMDVQVPLRSIEVHSIQEASIQSYCGKAIMIDFANKRLGGGVLRNGCVQEEVLFSIFPEAVVSKIVCEQLDDSQALIIYGARRFSNYTGYSDSFEYQELKNPTPDSLVQKSILVAIDATDFSKIPSQNYQYSKKGVRREINKAVAGFSGADLDADQEMKIASGRWGCGAFKGDEQLKLLIQWVAASEANRQLIYITDEQKKVNQFRLMIKEFQFMCTLDIIGILDEYYRVRNHVKNPLSLMDYLKNYIV